jgi:hypothetical protein
VATNNEINRIDSHDSLVYETSWLLDSDDNWMAYEFAFAPRGPAENKVIVDLENEKYRAFINEYATAIKDGGYNRLIGLRAWPGRGFRGGLEITEGSANIMLKPVEVSRILIRFDFFCLYCMFSMIRRTNTGTFRLCGFGHKKLKIPNAYVNAGGLSRIFTFCIIISSIRQKHATNDSKQRMDNPG